MQSNGHNKSDKKNMATLKDHVDRMDKDRLVKKAQDNRPKGKEESDDQE